jgi:mannosyltransferase
VDLTAQTAELGQDLSLKRGAADVAAGQLEQLVGVDLKRGCQGGDDLIRGRAVLTVLQAREVARAHRHLGCDLPLGQLALAAQRAQASAKGVGAFGLGVGAADWHAPQVYDRPVGSSLIGLRKLRHALVYALMLAGRHTAAGSSNPPRSARQPMPATASRSVLARQRLSRAAPSSRLVVGGLIVVAAWLRLPTVGLQSFWYDEAVTVHRVLHPSLVATLQAVPGSESNPPLYYLLAWGWTRVFGTSEAGIRSLSATVGIATVPVVWATARRLAGGRAAVMAAGIVAVNPFLVWYSQEARPYALVVLAASLSLYWWVRARQERSRRALGWWAVFSALAIATHYFAGFLVVAEAVWLLADQRDRRSVRAVGVVALGMLALTPLALVQAGTNHTDWIGRMSLSSRLLATPEKFALGETATRVRPLLGLAAVVLLLLAGCLAVTRRGEGRPAVRGPLVLALASLGLPLVLLAVGHDYIWPRNLITALVPLSILGGVALAVPPPRLTLLVAVAIAVVSVAAIVAVDVRPRLQRADWRDLAPAIGAARQTRAVVVPFVGDEPLENYLPRTTSFPKRGVVRVREIVVVGWSPARYRGQLGPAFRLRSQRQTGLFEIASVRSARPQPVSAGELTAHPLDTVRARVLLQKP